MHCIRLWEPKISKEIWKKDEKRKKYIEKQGYKLYVVWESDYKKEPENTIKKCLQFLTS